MSRLFNGSLWVVGSLLLLTLVGLSYLAVVCFGNLLALCERSGPSFPEPDYLVVQVVKVVDGDTFWAANHEVRLCHPSRRWFDVEEMYAPNEEGVRVLNPRGLKAKAVLSNLIMGKTVTLYPHNGYSAFQKDRYGRLLAECEVDGFDVATQMWYYEKP